VSRNDRAVSILIVDDDAPTRRRIGSLIEDALPGTVIGGSASAQEGLDAVATGAWQLVLLDLHMPNKSGFDALAELKASRPSLPVIVLSGLPRDQFATAVARLGADACVTKDRASEDLVAAIVTALAARPETARS
jgi:two-component system invasion response regulator UvrY